MCTGHRHLGDAEGWVGGELARVARRLTDENGMRTILHGGAMGSDLLWAGAADETVSPRIEAYLPFPEQAEGFSDGWRLQWEWNTTLRTENQYGRADRRVVAASQRSVRGFHVRNDWMIRDSDAVVAVVHPRAARGGTVSVMRKVRGRKPMIVLDVARRVTTLHTPTFLHAPAAVHSGGA